MAGIKLKFEVRGVTKARAGFRALGDDSVFRDLGKRAGDYFARVALGNNRLSGVHARVQPRKAGSARVVFSGHPAMKSEEFGRVMYYRGYTGRNVRSGVKFRSSRGYRARPFIGVVKGDKAIRESRPGIEKIFGEGLVSAASRLFGGGA